MNMISTMNVVYRIFEFFKSRDNERISEEFSSNHEMYESNDGLTPEQNIRTEHPTIMTTCPTLTACYFKRVEI